MGFLSNNAIFIALAAAGGVIATFWGYVKIGWERLTSYIIVKASLEDEMERAVTLYCMNKLKRSMLGNRFYRGMTHFVRPMRRNQAIGYEIVGDSTIFFWSGWCPLWINKPASKDVSNFGEQKLTLCFLEVAGI